MEKEAPKSVAAAVLNSLRGGVVPRIGLEYITVGRKEEISALLDDVEIIEQGGSTFRFLVGNYGSGKTFLMHVLRNYVCERGFVVSDVEISNDRRFYGNHGQGIATYKALISHLSTQFRPDGGALTQILDRWISKIQNDVVQLKNILPDNPNFLTEVNRRIFEVVTDMVQQVNGFAFGQILSRYYKAYVSGDEILKHKVISWFMGEYKTRLDSRTELGVSLIVTDDNWYDMIKLIAGFVVQAGFKGLYLCFDELPNICAIPSKVGREYNYNKLLSIYNDVLQGSAKHLGILMCNTPIGMEDTQKGVYSLGALKTRICDGKYLQDGMRDMAAPIIHLNPLKPAELYILLEKLTDMHANLYGYIPKLGHDEFIHYLRSEYQRTDNEEELTVRDIIRNYITLLNLVHQHPEQPLKETLLV